MGFHRGPDRSQTFIFPPTFDELVPEDSPVRFIDQFVESLDLAALGFSASKPAATGRPGYFAGDLLKAYFYGYLHSIRSSRRLEAETIRNVEMMWLLCGVRPDHKTIADFRRKNKAAFEQVFQKFLLVCYSADLIGGEGAAVDGTGFKAVNSPTRYLHSETIEKQLAACEGKVVKYLSRLDEIDAIEAEISNEAPGGDLAATLSKATALSKERLQDHVEFWERRTTTLQSQKKQLDELVSQREGSLSATNAGVEVGIESGVLPPEVTGNQPPVAKKGTLKEGGLTDPDCVRLGDKRKGSKVGYNVQLAVDTKHDLIVVADVTRAKNDRGQLFPMAKKTSEVLTSLKEAVAPSAAPASSGESVEEETTDGRVELNFQVGESPVGSGLEILADAGYHTVTQLEACEENGMIAYVPNQRTSGGYSTNGVQVFPKDMFRYNPDANHYVCPAGQILGLTARETKAKGRIELTFSNATACKDCPLKAHCTQSRFRKISRMENEAVSERTAQRVAANPEKVRQRKGEIEHVFGNLKTNGHDIFLTRGRESVLAELQLSALGHNLKRCLNIAGVPKLLEALVKVAHLMAPPPDENEGKPGKMNPLALGSVG